MSHVAVLPPIKSTVRVALMNLTVFEKVSTQELIAMARALPGGTKVHIPDRLTAIVLLLGTRPVATTGESCRRSHSSCGLSLDCHGG